MPGESKVKKVLNYLYGNKIVWYGLVIILAVIVTMQNVLAGENHFWGGTYTYYNNYVVFKTSFFNLINDQNLYAYHLDKYADLFKYSPTFSLFMGLFYYLPDWLGLGLWNLLNAVVLLYAITTLPNFSGKKMFFLLLFVIIELVLSLQNCQSNALIAGLTILAFTSMEKGEMGKAAFFICCGAFIKIFLIVACLFFLFYPKKGKFIFYIVLWAIIFAIVPGLVIGFPSLVQQYKNWLSLVNSDHENTVEFYKNIVSYSFYWVMEYLSGVKINKTIVLAIGTVLLLSPLLLYKKYQNLNFRLGYLSLLLIWMVVFNHKAESPSFIIAMAGVGIWCLNKEKSKVSIALLIITLFLTSLFFTDLIPVSIRKEVDKPFVKSLMACLMFIVVLIELALSNFHKNNSQKIQ